MTDETRETLTVLALELEKTAATCDRLSAESSTRSYRQHADRRRKEAAALRDVLTPRTCGTCRHAVASGAWLACTNRNSFGWQRHLGANDGCLKGWQAREGEGGGK